MLIVVVMLHWKEDCIQLVCQTETLSVCCVWVMDFSCSFFFHRCTYGIELLEI
jgi:hypothetical protein